MTYQGRGPEELRGLHGAQREGWLHRSPRPLILWGGVLLVVLGALGFSVFLFRIGTAIADAYERAAQTGQPVPEMGGGIAALLTAVAGFAATLWPIVQGMQQRHAERMDQQARGSAPPPFPPSQPSEPDYDGPRPGENHQ